MLKRVMSLVLLASITTTGVLLSSNSVVQAKEITSVKSTAATGTTVSKSAYHGAWETYTVKYPTLEKGDKGNNVKTLQKELNKINNEYKIGKKLTVDGNFGSDTESMVKAVQGYTGVVDGIDKCTALTKDGIAGSYTWGKIIIMIEE